jgi:hypothetical protein
MRKNCVIFQAYSKLFKFVALAKYDSVTVQLQLLEILMYSVATNVVGIGLA